MTNQEKAQEILNEHCRRWISNFIESKNLSRDDNRLIRYQIYNALIEMAKWKDHQYSEIIKEECNASYESGYAEGRRNSRSFWRGLAEEKSGLRLKDL